ncbi:uncharacterized protein LOC143205577 [Rhynchophorus ferrugineus]|uniref:uncharacterized protein LOC143205577 n=1 Tax=Rhynchophorus ferrugineus TaxID=354439 RepID=UPI003FCCBFF9
MFNMRLKIGSIRNNEWRCCFCLHVRTATIAFGVWHLLLHILALAVLALVMRNHSYFVQHFEESDFLPTPLSKVKHERPYYLPTTQDGRSILPSDVDMGAILTICTLSITLLMVYGAIKGKPKQILPFFFLQLFDLAITTLTATGYFCYLRSVHGLVSEHWHNLPFRQQLLSLSPQTLSLLVLVTFLVSMLWKAYWIGVVWRCYKYLTLKQQATHNTIHYILPSVESDRNDPDYGSLFLDNETALFGPLKQTPPPSYQDVMDEQPPPYPATTTIVQEVPVRRFLFTYTPEEPFDAGQTVGEVVAQSSNVVRENILAKDNEQSTVLKASFSKTSEDIEGAECLREMRNTEEASSSGQTPEHVEAEYLRKIKNTEEAPSSSQKPEDIKADHFRGIAENADLFPMPENTLSNKFIIPALKKKLFTFATNKPSENAWNNIEIYEDKGAGAVLPGDVLEASTNSEKSIVKEGALSTKLSTDLSQNVETGKFAKKHDNVSDSANRFEINIGCKESPETPVSVTHSPTLKKTEDSRIEGESPKIE